MAIRVDIDEQDLLRLHKDTARRFSRETALLAASCAIIALAAAGAVAGLWRAYEALAEARFDVAVATGPAVMLGLCLLCLTLLCSVSVLIAKMRGKHERARRQGAAKPGLTTGRFEFLFTDAALIIKGAEATRRAAWASLDRIAETKSSIVFWRRGAIFAFMPKDALSDPAFYEKLLRIHGPQVSNKLSTGKDGGVDPHRISFECSKEDYEEFERYALQQADAPAALLQAIFQWRAWPPVLFFFSLAMTSFAGFVFIKTLAIQALAVAALAGLAAVLIFVLKPTAFRGAAHPFRKPRRWPYAQTDLVSVALFKSGVCVTRSGVEDVYSWAAIDRFINCPLTAYLTLSPVIALPLPKRAFLDKVHFQTFTTYARAQIKDARTHAAVTSKARLARQLAPGLKRTKPSRTAAKALPPATPAKALPKKPAPKALPPKSAPKGGAPKTKSKSAVDAVRSAARARAAAQ